MLNRFERSHAGEAVVEYLDSNLRVVRPGAYVRCAVTGAAIPLEDLRYWSVEHQEPYASPEAVMQRLGMTPRDAPRDAPRGAGWGEPGSAPGAG